ncbi:MAG: hypothetical protein SWY16_24225 [Cyanobacteriota bacterium]|nr:hypothetical protein [Cyanobacteriota bacterium]
MPSAFTSPFVTTKLPLYLSTIFLVFGAIAIVPYGDFRDAAATAPFLTGIGIMSLGFVLSWGILELPSWWFWTVTLLSRVILLPMYPGDDVWRYLWEGYIQNLGFSPYHLAPNAAELVPLRTPWWELMNHPDVSAIYPPLTQWGFRGLAAIAPSVLVFKLGFVLADLAVCWLLARRFGDRDTLLYAWNPLILYSFAGGAHYDSWFILPVVMAWLAWDGGREKLSALGLGLSVAIKWMSLPMLSFLVLPALKKWQGTGSDRRGEGESEHFSKQVISVVVLGLLPMAIASIPFCNLQECPLIPTSSTFVSHGRSAEFFPYLVSQIWPPSMAPGFNKVYLIPLGLVGLLLLWKSRQFFTFAEGYFFALLVLSPIVHAWYFTWIIPFAVASRNLGTRLVSISAFAYFMLPYYKALGEGWYLQPPERYFLWLPFVLGCFWTAIRWGDRGTRR